MEKQQAHQIWLTEEELAEIDLLLRLYSDSYLLRAHIASTLASIREEHR
jgi:hypothetical protein